jgi:deazaflavin-dependent oxidoreductase (nitroreductase family)
LYRWRLGWILGRRFVLIEHRGRKTGIKRYTVLEVIETVDGDPLIAAGFGPRSDWLLNITANPRVSAVWSRDHFAANAKRLTTDEAEIVFDRYRRDHRIAAKGLGRVVGVSLVDDVKGAAEKIPVLVLEHFGPNGRPSASGSGE